ncbi:MAG: hypothetical protein ACRC8P_00195 [Spiroplasma sp.]
MNNRLLIAGVITSVASLLILLLLSVWIGSIGLIIGISLIIGGCLIKK